MHTLVRDGLRIHTVRRVASRAIRQSMQGFLQPLETPGDQTRFMCVRNPHDRLVSAFSHFKALMQTGSNIAPKLAKLGYSPDMVFTRFLDVVLSRHYADEHTSFQVDRMGLHEIDILCPYEKLQEGWDRLRVLYSFLLPLETVGETEHEHWEGYYTVKQRRMVNQIFNEDVALHRRALTEHKQNGRRSNTDTGSKRIIAKSGV